MKQPNAHSHWQCFAPNPFPQPNPLHRTVSATGYLQGGLGDEDTLPEPCFHRIHPRLPPFIPSPNGFGGNGAGRVGDRFAHLLQRLPVFVFKQYIFLQIPYTSLVTANERWIYSYGFTAGFTPEPEQTNAVSVLPATHIPLELIVLT
ncbi:hypothetical protein [Ferroacidibacillus organovorans]|uniref:Uncharacterized protein n=1 Tax=Ferroacidibacillus organovorans TaxID=1765683 RepID=A0A853KDF6_9BACL|nr:hypothetical protein [Ferroacidibacillus organovorans]KYP81682.1 hypothetical protein AYJ22_06055 [Ferroacidibacillus organovorans]OAG94219.1 hypothetical protein AYW79_06265 [Ferroacidibacillus organovorans]